MSVSYTHLDVYKRQGRDRGFDGEITGEWDLCGAYCDGYLGFQDQYSGDNGIIEDLVRASAKAEALSVFSKEIQNIS